MVQLNLRILAVSFLLIGSVFAQSSTTHLTEKPVATTLNRIAIYNNYYAPDRLILSALALTEGDELTQTVADQAARRVMGLRIFQKVTPIIVPSANGALLKVYVRENPYITGVTFDGVRSVSINQLETLTQTKPYQLLNLDSMRADVQAITDLYAKEGYSYARVYAVDRPTSGTGPLVFKIAEGTLESITITGNLKTKDYVILREMTLKPGMPIQDSTFKSDIRRIYNLNFFTALDPQLVPGKEPNTYDMQLKLAERPPGSLNVGGGYSDRSGLFLFTDLNVNNFLGSGQAVALRGQFGDDILNYEFKYHNPWMWYPRRSLTFRAWHRQGLLDVFQSSSVRSFRDNQTSSGSDITIGIPITYDIRTTHTIRGERVDVSPVASIPAIRDYSIQSYKFGISNDTRDVWFNPRSGAYAGITIEKGFQMYDSSLNFEKYDLSLKKFFPTLPKQTIATRLDIGVLQGTNKDTLEESIGYVVGGQSTVRGYDRFFARGRRSIVSSIEYRWLMSDVFQWVLFVDAGTAPQSVDRYGQFVGSSHSIFSLSKWRVGKGIGIRINSPIGPLRLDFANSDEGLWRIHFSIGHAF